METDVLPQFRRLRHQQIAKLLRLFDKDLLLKAQCFFGGGTAITLSLGEYRESVDIDFLCSSPDGFRLLRNLVGTDFGPLLSSPVKHARDVTSNQYKILTVLQFEDVRVKVELIREGNTTLTGALDPALGVPLLSRTDLWAQKLMANADRVLDKSTMSRDIIDLAMMIRGWGPLPRDAFDKAHAAYGDAISRGFNNALGIISDRAHLVGSMNRMGMDLELANDIFVALDDASAALPLGVADQAERDRRIHALSGMEGAAGAASLFWKAACDIGEGTPAGVTNWAQVERHAIYEGIVTHEIDGQDVIDAVAKLSPASVSATRMKVVTEGIWQMIHSSQSVRTDQPRHRSPSL